MACLGLSRHRTDRHLDAMHAQALIDSNEKATSSGQLMHSIARGHLQLCHRHPATKAQHPQPQGPPVSSASPQGDAWHGLALLLAYQLRGASPGPGCPSARCDSCVRGWQVGQQLLQTLTGL